MENFKHTPGPWKVNSEYPAIQIGTSKRPVCTTWGSDEIECFPDRSEGIANAHLIAAAPDLLEALQQILDGDSLGEPGTYSYMDIIQKHYRIARAAIAKATNQKEVENESI